MAEAPRIDPPPADADEEVVVAMLAACEATIRHLWDIAGRFENRECDRIREEIHRLNTITLPTIRDLQARATVEAPVPAHQLDLERLAAFCEQTAADGILPSLAWFAETAAALRALPALRALVGQWRKPRRVTARPVTPYPKTYQEGYEDGRLHCAAQLEAALGVPPAPSE